ncbi:hypothetical protein AB7M18_002661 [Pseudomonas viridiflava]
MPWIYAKLGSIHNILNFPLLHRTGDQSSIKPPQIHTFIEVSLAGFLRLRSHNLITTFFIGDVSQGYAMQVNESGQF